MDTSNRSGSIIGAVALLVIAGIAPPVLSGPMADGTGAEVYRAKCASCHGPNGEGVEDEYPKPLEGDRSVAQLARLIARTMPKDAEGTCVGEEAEKVAAYIHESFYSPIARARNKPARVELSRLTVRQYRNAVTDLIGGFRGPSQAGDEPGLKGSYFKGGQFRNNDRQIERVDPVVAFDFGVKGPEDEKFEPSQFSIRWEGSIVAPETGEYDLIVRTDHAARLWVNDQRRPLIDAWVKSGNDNEYRESITLLGGRAYPIKLEFSKAKQGVQDKKDAPKPEVPASIALAWKPPHRAVELVPARYLRTGRAAEGFVLRTPFPPDDRSIGYERGTSISKEWDQAATDSALEITAYVAARLPELAGVKDDAGDRPERLKAFARTFAERAFRRPLDAEQARLYVDQQFGETPDAGLALKRSLLLVLKSPRFLYREIGGGSDPYDVASRIAFGLWDSLPDRPLLEAAAQGKLGNRDQVVAQTERMLNDPRTRSKVRDFLLQWLKVDQSPDLGKEPELFPGFGPEVASDLRTSLDIFLEDIVWSDSADFRRFLLAEEIDLNGRLARIYGVDLPADAPFQKVKLEGARAGVLTHPYLMSAFAYTATTSPIHRGVFVVRGILGQTLRPPPAAVAPLAPDLHPDLTTRQRIALQTSPNACQTCHGLINPLGYPFENYDAIGRWRTEEKARPIDASGSYQPRAGDMLNFGNARDLALFLASSEEAHDAFVEKLFHDIVKQPIRAYGPTTQAELRQFFASHDFHVRKLMVEIVARTALAGQNSPP